MWLRHTFRLEFLVLAFFVAALFAVTGASVAAEAAERPPVSPGDNETKPRQYDSTARGDAQPDLASSSSPDGEGGGTVTLRDITVTATRTEREVFSVPSSVSVVDKKAMEREPRPTIAEHLRDIPGVEVSDGGMGGGTKRVGIRGESPSRVLVLIDGMKISEQKSMDGSMIMIDPLNVERIDVIKGPASVLYGSDAIGGVVNIITKKGGTEALQGTVAFTADSSNDSLTPYASLYGSWKGFGYRISGDYTDAGDKRGGSGIIDDTGYMQSNLSAYLDYAWDKGTVGGGYDRFWGNISIPGAESGGAEITMHLPKWQRERWHAFAELNKLSGTLQKIRLTGFIQETQKDFWNDIRVQQRTSTYPVYMQIDVWQHPFVKNKQTTYGGNVQTDWTFGDDHYVIAGVEYLYDDLDARDDRRGWAYGQNYNAIMGMPVGPQITMQAPYNDIFNYDAHQRNIALFAQDEWSFLKNWTATIGLRGTWIESALDDTDDATVQEKSSRDSHVAGSLGLVYSGFQDWRLRALYSQGYRYPLLNQLYIGTTHGSSGMLHPNPSLKPETSHNFEIGTRHEGPDGVTADLAAYYSLAKDYISSRSMPGTNDTLFENVDKMRSYGVELTLSRTWERWHLTPYVSGAYIRRTFDRGDNGGKTSNTGDPEWTGRAGVRYERAFSPAVTVYADAYGRFAARAREDLSDGTRENHAGWGTANFAVGARLGEKQNYFVDVNCNNLFNKRYTPASSALEDPGFHVVTRVGMEF
ncbi:MAG: TonB-dependent receptor [Desulfovibrio sp.]|jgi:hemoglobin/transferrin/lactoferrin receptor protein|nr:TonB-dependent receptor [Desulfovibrio sp.]